MQAIWSFSCSLAITRSSLFGLHLGRKTFQNSFNTWVTFSKMSNWNVKPGPKNVKTCECSDNKRNVVLRTTRVRRLLILQTSASENVLFSFFFFLFGLLYTCNCLLRTCSQKLPGKKCYYESTTFPRISILPVVKVRVSTILLADGLQREPGVDITVRKDVKYLEDQNR